MTNWWKIKIGEEHKQDTSNNGSQAVRYPNQVVQPSTSIRDISKFWCRKKAKEKLKERLHQENDDKEIF